MHGRVGPSGGMHTCILHGLAPINIPPTVVCFTRLSILQLRCRSLGVGVPIAGCAWLPHAPAFGTLVSITPAMFSGYSPITTLGSADNVVNADQINAHYNQKYYSMFLGKPGSPNLAPPSLPAGCHPACSPICCGTLLGTITFARELWCANASTPG